MNKKVNSTVCEHGINDMPRGWTKENNWNKIVYKKWKAMLERVYSSKCHNDNPTYINTTIQLEFNWLSYFSEHVKEINGYDEEKFLNGELELDKDIKSNGQNKEYSIENCMFVDSYSNRKQSNKTRDNTYLQKENHPMYGKHHTNESKQKISNKNKGNLKGKKHPKATKVVQYDLDGNLIKIWDCIQQAEDKLGICRQTISDCCRKKSKSAGGFYWEYYNHKNK